MFYMKKFVRSVWRHYECCCLGNEHVRCSAFFKKTKLASRISCMYVVKYLSFKLLWSFGGWLSLKKTFVEYRWNYGRIFSKWLIYILKAFFKGFLTRYCTMHEIEYFQKLSWNPVYIYISFRSQSSQSQLGINYHSKQVKSNKLSPF